MGKRHDAYFTNSGLGVSLAIVIVFYIILNFMCSCMSNEFNKISPHCSPLLVMLAYELYAYVKPMKLYLLIILECVIKTQSDSPYYIPFSSVRILWISSSHYCNYRWSISQYQKISSIDGLVLESGNSIANTPELRLSYTNPSISMQELNYSCESIILLGTPGPLTPGDYVM